MKRLYIALLAIFMSSAFAFAGEYSEPSSEYGDVKYYDFGLSVSLDGDIAKLEWGDFPKERGFQYYKLMYSTTVSNPVYPDQNAAYVGTSRTDVDHKMALKSWEYHYFRICAITLNDDYSKYRYCGDVQKIVVEQDYEVYEKETEKHYTKRYKDIEYYDFDFQVEISDSGKVSTRWNSYLTNRGFQYYKLLYSTKYANPSYPELSAKYVGDDIDDSGNSFYLSEWEHHYFRICAITDEGYGVTGRYCSNTRKHTISSTSTQSSTEKEKEENSSHEGYGESDDLSDDMKQRIDEVVAEFIQNLESQGYTQSKIEDVINATIKRLDSYVKIPKYTKLASYMQSALEIYLYEDELQELFDSILEGK